MGVWQVKRGSMVVFKILKTDSMFIRLILNIQCIIAALVDQYKTFLCTQGIVRGCHRERGWNQQIMMLENGRFHHSMYLGIL
jgi:hypothetical protein